MTIAETAAPTAVPPHDLATSAPVKSDAARPVTLRNRTALSEVHRYGPSAVTAMSPWTTEGVAQ